MNLFPALTIAAAVGLLCHSYSGSKTIEIAWADTVGARLTNELNNQARTVETAAERMNKTVEKIKETKPVEYRSHADDVNDCIRQINECMG